MFGGDVPLLIEVASAPVLNGCVQRGYGLLGGLCQEQWPPTAHHESAVQPPTGRFMPVHRTELFIFLDSHYSAWLDRIYDRCCTILQNV